MASSTERPVYVYILGLAALILFGANMAVMLERELCLEPAPSTVISAEAPISVDAPPPPPSPIIVDLDKVRIEVERVREEVERVRTEHRVRVQRVTPSIVLVR